MVNMLAAETCSQIRSNLCASFVSPQLPSASMALVTTTNLLIRAPTLFTLDGDSLQLVDKPKYCGIYFVMATCSGRRIPMHCTIGHWQAPTEAQLPSAKKDKILVEFREAVRRAWSSAVLPVFATVEAIDCGHRALATLHVQGGLSAKLWSLQDSVRRELGTQEKSRRTNFHFSVDAADE